MICFLVIIFGMNHFQFFLFRFSLFELFSFNLIFFWILLISITSTLLVTHLNINNLNHSHFFPNIYQLPLFPKLLKYVLMPPHILFINYDIAENQPGSFLPLHQTGFIGPAIVKRPLSHSSKAPLEQHKRCK